MPHKQWMFENISPRAADGAAAGSAFLAGAAWIAEVEPVITAAAGIVAIVAGAAAAWYHVERALTSRQTRRLQLAEREKENKRAKPS